MSFASPWMLVSLALVPLVIVLYVRAMKQRARRAAALAAQALVPTAGKSMRVRRHLTFVLYTIALAGLLVALAKPQTKLTLPRREGTVILAFDVSNSMAAKDLAPTRLEAARVAAKAFIEKQPATVKIGVVAFGDSAVTVQQPTTKQADVVAAIDRLSLQGGTSLGQGIFTSIAAIAGKPLQINPEALESDSAEIDIGYFGSGTIVMLSDGEDTGRLDPLRLAEVASVAGVRIHTIGLGTAEGTVVEVDDFNVATALDSESLTAIAALTNGTYYQAEDSAQLTDIYKTIKIDFKRVTKFTEISGIFAAGAGLLFLLGAMLSLLWFGRVV